MRIRSYVKRIVASITVFLMTIMSSFASVCYVSAAQEIQCEDGRPVGSTLDRFANNNNVFYNPCEKGCGGASSGVVTVLPGNSAGEKVWNWFASAGIDGVSNDASVIAGVIGNLMTESGLNPFVVSNLGYYGMYQAGGGRATTLKNAFDAAGIGNLWRSSPSSVSEEDLNKAIDVTLTTLTTSDDGSFRTFVNKLGIVGNKTPEAYAELFLVIVERAVNGSSEIEDPGVKNYVESVLRGNIKYQGTSGRRTNAASVFSSYANNTGEGSVTMIRNDVKNANCLSSGYSGSGTLVSGGMNLEQAKQFMEFYRQISPRNYEDSGSYLDKWKINNLTPHSKGGKCLSDLENCVAFTQYFICEYAGVCMGLPDGGKVVDYLLGSGKGFTNGGNTPRAYAVFSRKGGEYGHTGVVLGVDAERGKIVIGEAGCGNTIDFTNAKERDLAAFSNGNYVYAYTDGLIGL